MLVRMGLIAVVLALPVPAAEAAGNLDKITHILVIYLENRSFDNLFGEFPGANGLFAPGAQIPQVPLAGAAYGKLPSPPPGPFSSPYNPHCPLCADLAGLPNAPFVIDDVRPGVTVRTFTRDLVHRFYTNRAQIRGRDRPNDFFVAYSDARALAMGHYSEQAMSRTNIWRFARENLLLDNFFQGAFGGSFLNHFWPICACAPTWPNAPATLRSRLDSRGNPRGTDADSPYEGDNYVTAEGEGIDEPYAVNTAQYALFNDGAAQPLLPAQRAITIGDRLSEKNIDWAWYAGGWDLAILKERTPAQERRFRSLHFQWHHQPFAAFENFNPDTDIGRANRRAHLKDAAQLYRDIVLNRLPPVAFYKPAGIVNEHPNYSDFVLADREVGRVVDMMGKSAMRESFVVIITYDEFGGFFDHVKPPMGAEASARADYFGPGTRIPAILVSPLLNRRGKPDSTQFDTTSIVKFIAEKHGLERLPQPRFDAVESLARFF
jgi:acid phosphatase